MNDELRLERIRLESDSKKIVEGGGAFMKPISLQRMAVIIGAMKIAEKWDPLLDKIEQDSDRIHIK